MILIIFHVCFTLSHILFLPTLQAMPFTALRRKARIRDGCQRVSDVLKLIEFINEEVKEISRRLTRVTPREVSEN